jgi:N4-acetylcytidine amidohydrolase
LIFKKQFLKPILSGKKTQTRRVHSRLLKVGNTYTIQVSRTRSTGHYLKITKLYHQKLGEVGEEEAQKEGFDSLEEFKQAWIEINGSWNPKQEVIVYEFEKTEPSIHTTLEKWTNTLKPPTNENHTNDHHQDRRRSTKQAGRLNIIKTRRGHRSPQKNDKQHTNRI